MRKILPVLLIAALIFSLPACGKKNANDAELITVNLSEEPKTIDPLLNDSFDGNTYLIHLFEGLTTVDKNLTIVPGAAESWEVSSDGLTYTFHIRKDANWSDGVPIRAQDFVFAWKRLIDPATATVYTNLVYYIKNAEKIILGELSANELGIAAANDKTLIVQLESACPYFLQIVGFSALFPVREDIVSADPEGWANNLDLFVGNGPFILTEWENGSHIMMEKNPNYWNTDAISNIAIEFALISDETAAYTAFKKDDILFTNNVPPTEIENAKKAGTLTIGDMLGTYYYLFNTQKKPFDDPRVRKALALAVDRQYLVDCIFLDGRKSADALVPPGLSEPDGSDFHDKHGGYYQVTSDSYDSNVTQAQQLLSDAGYPNGEGFPTIEFISNDAQGHIHVAEAIQQMWLEKLGVNMRIYKQGLKSFQDNRRGINWDVARGGWIGEYSDPNTFLEMWTSVSAQNDAKYKNPEFDKLVFNARAEPDQKKRMEMLHQAEGQLIGRDMAILPITFYNDVYLTSPKLKGVVTSPLSIKYFYWVELTK